MFNIGPQEMIVIFVVALVVLGPEKLPGLARSIGKGLAEFRRASAELRGSLDREMQNIEQEARMRESVKDAVTTPVPPASLHEGEHNAELPYESHPDVHSESHEQQYLP
jgi:sec-independent protein translocase protein TatA